MHEELYRDDFEPIEDHKELVRDGRPAISLAGFTRGVLILFQGTPAGPWRQRLKRRRLASGYHRKPGGTTVRRSRGVGSQFWYCPAVKVDTRGSSLLLIRLTAICLVDQ